MLPIVHHPKYDAGFAPGHRFPMSKYSALMTALRQSGLMDRNRLHTPDLPDHAVIARAHASAYVRQVEAAAVAEPVEKAIGFPVSRAVADRARYATGGTLLAARLALEHGLACNTAGGSHHARFAQGAGFCTFNDVAVAALDLLASRNAERILIVDCDVHQGDGTADILGKRSDVFTLSIHAERNYPEQKVPSHFDVPLADRTPDHAYLSVLKRTLDETLRRFEPDFVFYNAGVDVHRDDRLGRLSLSDQGIVLRDEHVIGRFRAMGIPVCGVIGGGYGHDIEALGKRHAILFQVAERLTR